MKLRLMLGAAAVAAAAVPVLTAAAPASAATSCGVVPDAVSACSAAYSPDGYLYLFSSSSVSWNGIFVLNRL